MPRYLWILFSLCFLLLPASAHAQNSLLDQLNKELAPLSRLETLLVLKFAENKVSDQLQAIATDPAPKNPDEKSKHLLFFFKTAASSYGSLALLTEKRFPDVATTYRARTDLYSDFVRGKLKWPEFEAKEKANETAKQQALEQQLTSLQKTEPAITGSKSQSLPTLGDRIGSMIVNHGMSAASIPPAKKDDSAKAPAALAPSGAAGSVKDGVLAQRRGDYAAAAEIFRPLAERGDVDAQFFLAGQYEKGNGVERNPAEAMKWFRRAADQGDHQAQYFLATSYALGEDVKRDFVAAYMWFSVAAAKGDKRSAEGRELIEPRMTPAQIAEAKKRASAWKPAKIVR